MPRSMRRFGCALSVVLVGIPASAVAQSSGGQPIDEEYTRLIAEHLQDERITTELVDHLPASETVPTPLDFHGRIVGTPDELTYAADIHRYMRAIASATYILAVTFVGLALGPYTIGRVSVALDGDLRTAMLLALLANLVGVAFLAIGARHLERDETTRIEGDRAAGEPVRAG